MDLPADGFMTPPMTMPPGHWHQPNQPGATPGGQLPYGTAMPHGNFNSFNQPGATPGGQLPYGTALPNGYNQPHYGAGGLNPAYSAAHPIQPPGGGGGLHSSPGYYGGGAHNPPYFQGATYGGAPFGQQGGYGLPPGAFWGPGHGPHAPFVPGNQRDTSEVGSAGAAGGGK